MLPKLVKNDEKNVKCCKNSKLLTKMVTMQKKIVTSCYQNW